MLDAAIRHQPARDDAHRLATGAPPAGAPLRSAGPSFLPRPDALLDLPLLCGPGAAQAAGIANGTAGANSQGTLPRQGAKDFFRLIMP
jgi:hypothetical protein